MVKSRTDYPDFFLVISPALNYYFADKGMEAVKKKLEFENGLQRVQVSKDSQRLGILLVQFRN